MTNSVVVELSANCPESGGELTGHLDSKTGLWDVYSPSIEKDIEMGVTKDYLKRVYGIEPNYDFKITRNDKTIDPVIATYEVTVNKEKYTADNGFQNWQIFFRDRIPTIGTKYLSLRFSSIVTGDLYLEYVYGNRKFKERICSFRIAEVDDILKPLIKAKLLTTEKVKEHISAKILELVKELIK